MIITKGFGNNHLIITQGYGKKIENIIRGSITFTKNKSNISYT